MAKLSHAIMDTRLPAISYSNIEFMATCIIYSEYTVVCAFVFLVWVYCNNNIVWNGNIICLIDINDIIHNDHCMHVSISFKRLEFFRRIEWERKRERELSTAHTRIDPTDHPFYSHDCGNPRNIWRITKVKPKLRFFYLYRCMRQVCVLKLCLCILYIHIFVYNASSIPFLVDCVSACTCVKVCVCSISIICIPYMNYSVTYV